MQDVEARILDTDCAMVMACSTAYPVLSSLGAERFLNWVFPRRKLLQHHRHGWRNRVSEETAGKKCAGFERSSGSFTQCIGWQTLVPRLSVPASTRRLACSCQAAFRKGLFAYTPILKAHSQFLHLLFLPQANLLQSHTGNELQSDNMCNGFGPVSGRPWLFYSRPECL